MLWEHLTERQESTQLRPYRSAATWENGSEHSGSPLFLRWKRSQVQTLSRPPHAL